MLSSFWAEEEGEEGGGGGRRNLKEGGGGGGGQSRSSIRASQEAGKFTFQQFLQAVSLAFFDKTA